jgi:UDP-N-acetyl-D-glucosamine dehydrogenase
VAHDPLVSHWDEFDWDTPEHLPDPAEFDAVIFAVPHAIYRGMNIADWLGDARPVIVDGFDVLRAEQRSEAQQLGCVVASIGRGIPH